MVAAEAMEGTDDTVRRAGDVVKGPVVVVKVARPDQDMRFDVPTVGPDTIENLQRHGAGALVIEAGKTVIVEREKMLVAADRHGIAVVGVRGSEPMPTDF